MNQNKLIRPIRQLIKQKTTVKAHSIHGPKHWMRVEANGIKIARQIGADELVVVLFALFHDSKRLHHSDFSRKLAEKLHDNVARRFWRMIKT